jgi:serine O-acetyltransferase
MLGTLIKSDVHRITGRSSLWRCCVAVCRIRTFLPVVTLRLCQATSSSFSRAIPHAFFRLLHGYATRRAGIDLHWSTKIGPGFALYHGWGTVIGRGVVIGKNVTVLHGVTIGQNVTVAPDGERHVSVPIIEDEVWIGPHAVITGGITIGKGSRIAANTVVFESIPSYSVVAGNPSSIIKTGTTPDVENRW